MSECEDIDMREKTNMIKNRKQSGAAIFYHSNMNEQSSSAFGYI